MQKPNLERLWQVWIGIGVLPDSLEENFKKITSLIKSKVAETVSILEANKTIEWYYFLIHNKENDPLPYFHLVFSLSEGVNSDEFLRLLPDYCLEPRKLDRKYGESIAGLSKTQLRNDEIEEAWKIIGEQSEWVIRMLNCHKDGEITTKQYIQFMHYFMNMMGLGHMSTFLMHASF